MFHWTDKRIEGHICLCYIAYTLLHYVQQKMRMQKKPVSEKSLRTILDHMQVSLLKHNDENLYLRAKPHDGQAALQQALNIKQLPSLLQQQHLSNYL